MGNKVRNMNAEVKLAGSSITDIHGGKKAICDVVERRVVGSSAGRGAFQRVQGSTCKSRVCIHNDAESRLAVVMVGDLRAACQPGRHHYGRYWTVADWMRELLGSTH
jgi:hypothetical protein